LIITEDSIPAEVEWLSRQRYGKSLTELTVDEREDMHKWLRVALEYLNDPQG
jgi:hypothetical protein